VKWVKDAATTPVTSSETIPFVPEREQNTSRSAYEMTNSIARRWHFSMTLLVSSSPRAHMTEIDLEIENVRSKPATGTPPAGALGLDPTGSPLTGSEHAEHVGEVLLAHLRAANHSATVVQIGETVAQKDPRRGASRGVVVRQSLRRFRVPVAGRDRVHQVAKAATKADRPDRDHLARPFVGGDRDDRLY
jgi:hypothetical protein